MGLENEADARQQRAQLGTLPTMAAAGSSSSAGPSTDTLSDDGAADTTLTVPADPEDGLQLSAGGKRSLRPRKSGLFYPSSTLAAHSNAKPFSKSAAKRESVLALGSIGHLQHLFSKQGIASKQRPQMAGNLTLAIGHAGESALLLQESPPSSPTLAGGRADALSALEGTSSPLSSDQQHQQQQPTLVLPPSPTPPTNKRLPYPDVQRPTDVDPEALLPDVIQAIDETCQQWDLIGLLKTSYRSTNSDIGHASNRNSALVDNPIPGAPAMERTGSTGGSGSGTEQTVDVLELIKHTTKTIRRVRAYLLAFPADVLASRLADHAGLALTQVETAALVPKKTQKHTFRRMSSYSQLPRVESRFSGSSFGPSSSAAATAATAGPSSSASITAAISAAMGANSGSGSMPSQSSSPVKRRSTTREPSESDAQSSTGHHSASNHTATVSPTNSPSKMKVLDDPLAVIRKSALDVLGMLRQLEESYRLPPDDPAYASASSNFRRSSALESSASSASTGSAPKARAFGSDVSGTGANASPSSSTILGSEGSAQPVEGEQQQGEGESGFLYRQGVRSDALQEERITVRNYVDTVDYVLSAILNERRGGGPGSVRSRSRISHQNYGSEYGGSSSRSSSVLGFTQSRGGAVGVSVEEEAEQEEGEMEDLDSDYEDGFGSARWNEPGRVQGGLRQRLLTLFDEILPADLRLHLRSKGPDSNSLLNTLADGHILCLAYNAALRRSRRPWGFIREEDIHALVGHTIPAEASKWTFRKIDNLRNLAAALRLRYAVVGEELRVVELDRDWDEQVRSGGRRHEGQGQGDAAAEEGPRKVRFEPRTVARQEEGWEEALAALVAAWLKALIDEAVIPT
ncbi:unnamed protein product [Tilletia controversa]|nr:unnamed protein product [Tilletia caries]CAD6908574.1 unnamed protein product [Tilletia caries]CAD6917421.1 unnamed protein product [Tilletia controversa]CAD6922027.1 unnamed protein product [Tilletia controversa]CAD6952875.1 unnamed protein product [Tilletia caries]